MLLPINDLSQSSANVKFQLSVRGRKRYFRLFSPCTKLGFTQMYEGVPQAHSAFTQGFTTTNSFHEGLYQKSSRLPGSSLAQHLLIFQSSLSFILTQPDQTGLPKCDAELSLVYFLPGKSLRQRNMKIKWKAQGHIRLPRCKWRSVEAAPWFSTSPSQYQCWGLTSLCFIVGLLQGHRLLVGLSLKLEQCIQDQGRALDGLETR